MVAVRFIRPKLTFAVNRRAYMQVEVSTKVQNGYSKIDLNGQRTIIDVKRKMLTALQSTDTCRAAARGGEAPCCSDKQ